MKVSSYMKEIKSKLVKLTALLLAFMILNCSIDPPDSDFTLIYQNNQVKEDISKNDIENIYEFITEVLLGIDNHVIEYDDKDQESELKQIDLTTLVESQFADPIFFHYLLIAYPSFSVNLTWKFVKNQYIPPDFSSPSKV